MHPLISGNKFRKLKYNLLEAAAHGYKTILTFGGAYSNHIAATAYAAKEKGFGTIGIIRGAELVDKWEQNPTLKFAHDHGMQFNFVSRETYRNRNTTSFLKRLEMQFGHFFCLPEGGSNLAAVRGCEEIIQEADHGFEVLCASVGTGATISGIINASSPKQLVLGFPAMKGAFIKEDIRNFVQKENWELQSDYHFGGYGKVNTSLIQFINDFKKKTQIPLDPIYTGKMVYGILDLVEKDYFVPGTNILAIHTGGLQGIMGMNQLLKKKDQLLIDL